MVKITKKVKRAWVTFTLPLETGDKVELLGSWDGWKKNKMKVKKSGHLALTKIIPIGHQYEFGYLINDKEWVCDDSTDFIETEFGSKNSVIKI